MEIIPAWAIRVDQNDRLIFQYITSELLATFEVRVRQVMPDGQMILSKFRYAPAAADTRYETTIVLGPGYLVSVSIITDGESALHGQSFGRISLNRLEADEPGPILELASGYVFDRVSVSWPTISPVAGAEQKGTDIVISSANPAAGADISLQFPAIVHTKIKSIMFSFVTAVAVADRRVRLRINVGATIYFEYVCTTTQAASLTYKYVFAPFGTAEVLTSTTVHCPIPELDVPPGVSISTSIDNLQAADDVSAAIIINNRRFSM